jgi:hypothetical protein
LIKLIYQQLQKLKKKKEKIVEFSLSYLDHCVLAIAIKNKKSITDIFLNILCKNIYISVNTNIKAINK